MKVLPGAIAWILFVIAAFMPQSTLQYATKTWDLRDTSTRAETYSTFVASLRTEISASIACDIKVTPQSSPPNDKYVYVDIINTNSKTITLAFKKTDVYLVGFKDKFNGEWRANFDNDVFTGLETSDVFSDARIRSELPYGGNYQDLVEVGKLAGDRGNLLLGVTSLSSYIDTIYGKDYNGKNKPKNIGQNLARFSLMSIQMIAEAARFKYIENEVKEGGMFDSFRPDTDIFLKLENNWDKISQKIHKASVANPKCGDVKVSPFPWDDIKPQMGLLKCKVGPKFIHPFTGNNDAAAAEAEAALWAV